MLQGQPLRLAQALLIVAPAFILFGYNQAGVGPLATLQSWVHSFPEIDTLNTTGSTKAHNSTTKGAVIASFQIGALAGALSCTVLGDWLGRRKTILVGALFTIIGQVLQTASFGLAQFVVGRVLLGIGIGQLSVAVPVWQSECSSAKHRGQHVVVDGICICLGYTLCNWIDFALSTTAGPLQWRLPLAISLAFSLVLLAAVFALPESPRWLVRVHRSDDAVRSLARYRGRPVDDPSVRAEIAAIDASLEQSAGAASLAEMFSSKDSERLLYRFALCIALQTFQQLCGGNLISVYASTIFEENLHMTPTLSKILASCAMTWKFLCSFIAFFAIDRLGRRVVFMVSGAGMCVCMVGLAVTNSLTDNSGQGAAIASAVFIFCFNAFYPIGFLGGNFLYCTEVAPVRLRVAMSAVSTANHWLWNFVVVMITPVALEEIGYRYYIVYAVISACIPVGVYVFYPETMNRSLEAINGVFREAESAWDIVGMARRLPQGEIADVEGLRVDKEKHMKEKEEVEERESV